VLLQETSPYPWVRSLHSWLALSSGLIPCRAPTPTHLQTWRLVAVVDGAAMALVVVTVSKVLVVAALEGARGQTRGATKASPLVQISPSISYVANLATPSFAATKGLMQPSQVIMRTRLLLLLLHLNTTSTPIGTLTRA
jgi:hypothetical protein